MRRFEWLEPRWALAAPTLAAISDVTLSAGAPLNIALNGADTDGDSLTYTVTSTNAAVTPTITPSTNHSLRIQVDDAVDNIHGTIVLRLFEDLAPKTTARIEQLANAGFYNGLTFHRVIKNFMIQGGDPQGTGSGGSGTQFDDEFNSSLQFTGRGLLAMAKSADDTNDSQFFITSEATRWLDFNHTIFGMLTEGDSILTAINNVATNSSNKPTNNVIMTKVEVIQDAQDGVLRLSTPRGTTGQSDVTVQASDGHGGTATRTFHVSIQADTNSPPPFLPPIDPLRTTVNTPVSLTIPVTNVGGVKVYYGAEVSPASANLDVSVNADTGALTVTPKNGASGVLSIKVKVANSTAFKDDSTTGASVDTQLVPVYVSPAAPVIQSLLPDAGSSNPAGTTSHNNSSSSNTLTFHLTGLTPNAEVTLQADGQVIGQAVATGATMDVQTNGSASLLNGSHSITAIQSLRNQTVQVGNLKTTADLASPASSPLSITVAASSSGVPTVAGFQKAVAQDATLAFTSTDFSSHFSAAASATLQKVKITALPAHGALKLSGTAVTANQEIPLASLANLTYVPASAYNGTDTFTWTGSDGTSYATTGATVTITVGASSSTGSLSGMVYVNGNHNGARDPRRIGLKAVGIQLQQQAGDRTWNVVSSTMTDTSGNYSFTNLTAGTYKLLEIAQPSSYGDGPETAGSAGGTPGSDVISDIVLAAGKAGTGYLFGETGVAARLLSQRLFLLNTPPVTEYLSSLNKAPTLDLNGSSSGVGSSAIFTAGDSAVKIASSAKITDADGGCLSSMTVAITNLGDGDSEVLAATTTGITASYSGGVLRLTGAASLSTYQTVLQSITYKNSDTTPTTGDRAITVVTSDGVATSEIATATVTVKSTTSSTTPTASVTTAAPTINASSGSTSTTTITVTYADSDNGIDTSSFGAANITVNNGATVTSYSASGNAVTYTIKAPSSTWSASTQGTYTVSLAANQVKDKAGNYVAANSSLTTFKVDTVVPTASVTTAPPTLGASSASGNTTTLTVTYSDSGLGIDTTSFSISNITVNNGATVTAVSASGNAVTYTIKAPSSTWGASTQGTYTVALVASQVKDLAGNYVAANSSLTTFKVDMVNPTASVTTTPPAIKVAGASGSTTTLTVTYADSGAGMDTSSYSTSNLTVSNGATVTGVSASGNAVTYTIKAPATTWGASTQGTYTVSLVANQVKDLAGHYVAANASLTSFKVDTVVPTAAVTTAPPTIAAGSAGASTTTVTVTYSDTGSGLDTTSFLTSNLTVSNSATVTGVSVSGNAVTYTIKAPAATWGASTQGTYTVSLVANQVKDLVGNYVAANASLTSFKVDTVIPTAAVTTAPPAITTSSASESTTTLTVTYSDTGLGLDTSSFSTSNLTVDKSATVTAISVNGNAVTYTIKAPAATWGASTQGTYTISLAANQVKDLAGSYVAANASFASFTVNTSTSPTATVVRNGNQVNVTRPQGAGSLEFTAGVNQNTVTVNGQSYEYSTSEVTTFQFDGGGSDDVVELNGGDSAQTAEIHPSSATFHSSSVTVNVVNAKDIRIYAGSGDSEVQLFDSPGDDILNAGNTLAVLSGNDFSEMALDFKRVKASSTAGGQDTAYVDATDYVLTKEGSWINL